MICPCALLLFVSLFATLVGASKIIPIGDSLANSCHFAVEDQKFDLCPVLEGKENGWTVEFEKRTPPTVTRTQYKISLHGSLEKDQSLPDDEQCPEGSWICMTTSYRLLKSMDEAPQILQVIPVAGEIASQADNHHTGLRVSAQLAPNRENSHHDVLHIRLHGGYYVDKGQIADLQFTCDHSAEEPTTPSYYYSWNGTHVFRWRTKYACGINPSSTSPPPSNSDMGEGEEPPPDDPENGTDLLSPATDHPRRSLMMILFSSAAIVSLIIYTIYHPPRPVRHKVMSFLKSRPSLLRFRVGERVLLRWVEEEEMELADSEEDVMVNGDGESIFFADEESIPLKPSPRKGRVVSYGSAFGL